jgi:hypothetical protein
MRQSPRPPRIIVTPQDRERERRKTLPGWVVGWGGRGGLYLDDEGWLTVREDARVFSSWLHAFWASWLFPFLPIPFYGWVRRNRRDA